MRHIEGELGEYLDQLVEAGFDRVVGTSGTILSLGAVASAAQGGPPSAALRNRRISAKQLHRTRKLLTGLNLETAAARSRARSAARRSRRRRRDPARHDRAPARRPEITLCDLSLREGLVLDYIARHRKEIAQADRYPDVRRRSVVELAERCNYWPEHAQQVARLALALFDQTRGIHGLTDREREWLEYAALLHDIGVHISYERHHKHSYYLIRNGDLRGFEPDEIEIIALVARYHRRATPKRRHDGFGDLRRKTRRRGPHARGHPAPGREPRPQPLADRSPASSCTIAARTRCCSCGRRATPSSSSGRPAGTSAPFERLLGKPLRVEVSRTHLC